jgi:hypothetical protein
MKVSLLSYLLTAVNRSQGETTGLAPDPGGEGVLWGSLPPRTLPVTVDACSTSLDVLGHDEACLSFALR